MIAPTVGIGTQHPAIERAMREEKRDKDIAVAEHIAGVVNALTHKTAEGVVVQFPGRGEGRTKLFRVGDYKGMDGAREAARLWRDEQAVKLTDVLEFSGTREHRTIWSDGELDKVAQRAAWLAAMLEGMNMPFPVQNPDTLQLVRAAMVQVLPHERWRRLSQIKNIPNDLLARIPKFKREAEAEVGDAKFRERAERRAPALGKLAEKMPIELAKAVVREADRTGTETTTPGFMLGVVEKYIAGEIEKRTAGFEARLKAIETAVQGVVGDMRNFLEKSGPMLTAMGEAQAVHERFAASIPPVPEPARVPVVESITPELAKAVDEVKQMQEMLVDELGTIQRLASDIEDGKEGVDTRLRTVESEVMQLKAARPVLVPAVPVASNAARPAVVPVIGIMGPLPEQFAHVVEKVGAAAELLHLDNKRGTGANAVTVPDRVKWVIFNRFASHAQENGLRDVVGADHVVFVGSGGISSMVRAVLDVVERVNRGGGK